MFAVGIKGGVRARHGFTIIEVMIVVAIIGILSALAVPAFNNYVRRSRTGEVPSIFHTMFISAATYYSLEVSDRGIFAPAVTNCTAAESKSDWAPSSAKHEWRPVSGPGFDTLGVSVGDRVYYNYELDAAGRPSTCRMPANNPTLYTFRANGDLDDDGDLSTFELAVGTNNVNALYHGVGMYIVDELE